MKEFLMKFCRDKFNIVLLVIQVFAFILLAFGSLTYICTILFLVMESVFFVCWGIKVLVSIKRLKNNQEIYTQLPYSDTEIDIFRKNDASEIKHGKFKGIMFIIMGIVLLITILSSVC